MGDLRVWAFAALIALLAVPAIAHAQGDQAAGAPSNLTAEALGCHVALTWDAPAEDAGTVSGYQLLRGKGGSEPTILKADTMSTGTAHTDSTVEDGETYAYRVKAMRSGVASEESNTAEVSIPEASAPMPTEVGVTSVPIVVTSTTADYFVLFVTHDKDGAVVEMPVAVTLGEAGTTTLSENVEALPPARYRVEKYLVADPADVDGDCIDDITELGDPTGMSPVNPAHSLEIAHGAVAVPDRETFQSLGSTDYFDPNDEAVYVKFLLLGMDTDQPRVYFQNTKQYLRHQPFMDAVGLEGDDVMRGFVAYRPRLLAPDGSQGSYYYWQEIVPSFGVEARTYTLLAASMPLLQDDLALHLPNYRLPQYQAELPQYRESRIHLVFDEAISPSSGFLALNPGEGYGRLRTLQPDDRPHPRDIVVYEALPNELPRVAGIISTVPQTPLSHINLRAVQDSIPNAFIRNAHDNAKLSGLVGSYVRYRVTERGWELRAATPEEVEAHYESSRPSRAQTPERDLSITTITSLSDVGFNDWRAFGVKAANLAVLGTLGFPAGTVPDGFAIPFYFYDEFMKHHGFYGRISEMLAAEEFQADFEVQDDMLDALRDDIRDAESPQWIIDALTAMHGTFPEGQSLRYRSSTNNEDLPGFNGAGLYDSKTQNPDETEEDGIDKSLKQVWASLWTLRAFTEREFHRIDHLAAAMGVLVHPNFTDELANGVAVTFDPVYAADSVYYVNTQVGEDLVTNPEAHSVPEELRLRSGGLYAVLSISNQVAPGELLMSRAQLRQLRQHLDVIHNDFARLYNPAADEPFAMEIEFKITSDDILAIKQARPWVFEHASTQLPEVTPPPATLPVTGIGGGGGGGGGGPSGPSPSDVEFEWTVKQDIDELDAGHDMPTGMWSDGTTLWIAENGDSADDAIHAYDLESGELVEEREFELAETNRAPRGVWSDRQVIWLSDSGRNRLFAHELATGERFPERDLALAARNRNARGIWSDDSTIWVLDDRADALFAYDLKSGELLGEYALDSANGDPRGIWSDGVTVWVSDPSSSPRRLFAYRLPVLPDKDVEPGDGTLERVRDEEFSKLSQASNNSPRGIWSDGAVMYVADASDGKVYSYNMPDAIDARLASLTLEGIDIGEFGSSLSDYESTLSDEVTRTAVEVQAQQSGATVVIEPPDADEAAEGHQVTLEGVTEIAITVTSGDGSRKRVYRVRLGEPEPEPWPHCLRGDIAVGFSLVVYEGGTVEELTACAQSRDVTALYALHEGLYVSYILEAPDFVNAGFRELYADGVPALTPLVAGSDGPPSEDPVGDIGAPLSWPNCLLGEIAEGFSLVLYEGGSVEELVICAQGQHVTAVYALHEGAFVSYILEAPDFVTSAFRELFSGGVPTITPLVVKSDAPPPVRTEGDDTGNN